MRFIIQNYGFVYLVGSGSIPLPLLIVRKTVQVWSRAPPYVPENSVSRDELSRPVPRHSAHSPYSGLIWCLLTRFLSSAAAASIYLKKEICSYRIQERI